VRLLVTSLEDPLTQLREGVVRISLCETRRNSAISSQIWQAKVALAVGRTLWLLTDLWCVTRRRRELRNLNYHVLRLLLFIPNAIHWTLPSGHRLALPRMAVEIFGFAEGCALASLNNDHAYILLFWLASLVGLANSFKRTNSLSCGPAASLGHTRWRRAILSPNQSRDVPSIVDEAFVKPISAITRTIAPLTASILTHVSTDCT
jgi:hypothetical protein